MDLFKYIDVYEICNEFSFDAAGVNVDIKFWR